MLVLLTPVQKVGHLPKVTHVDMWSWSWQPGFPVHTVHLTLSLAAALRPGRADTLSTEPNQEGPLLGSWSAHLLPCRQLCFDFIGAVSSLTGSLGKMFKCELVVNIWVRLKLAEQTYPKSVDSWIDIDWKGGDPRLWCLILYLDLPGLALFRATWLKVA